MNSIGSGANRTNFLGWRSRVTRKLLTLALVLGGILSLLISAGEAYYAYGERHRILEENLQSIGQFILPALEKSLWAFDQEQVDTQLAGLARLPDITAVRLVQTGVKEIRYGDATLSDDVIESRFPLVHFKDGQKHELGTLSLITDLRDEHSRMIQGGIVILAGNALVLLLITVASVLLYQAIVMRRLTGLADELRKLTPEDLRNASLPPLPSSEALARQDELDELGASVLALKSTAGQALRDIEENRSLLRSLMDTIPDLIWLKDPQGRYLACNPRFEQFFGTKETDILGKDDYAFFDADLAEFFRNNDRLAIAADGPRINEEWLTFASDGYRGLFETIKTPMKTADGRLIGVLGIARDVSTQRRIAEELRELSTNLENRVNQKTADLVEAHERLLDTQFAMESVGIGITWADFETGRFIYANRFSSDLLGYSIDEMLQLRVSDIDPSFPPEAFQEVRETVRQQGHIQFDSTQRTKDGRLIPVEVAIHYHAGRGKSGAKLIAFISDITRRKEAAEELQQAKEAAEAANQAKSRFLANMSHEIRTPLNAILGLNYLLQRDGASPTQTDRLAKIEISGRHLLSLINDILDLAKIEAGRLELEHRNFHLSSVLDNVASIIRESATNKGLALGIDPDHVPLWLHGDATRLRQALLNFASNAVKFTESGSITLRALLQEDAGDGALWVRFEVVDSGIGLSTEQQARLFQVFQQADESTARKYGGTGLGLALTKRLVETLGGTVGVESTAGIGSTFWFTVPLQRGHGAMPATTDQASANLAESELRMRYKGTRILLAEDNPINSEVVTEILHSVGLDVSVAENGALAVDMARLEVFDLVLMDVQMPEMNGLEATRLIRTLPDWSGIPILALTANAFADDRRACLESGMNDAITKPVEPEFLYGALLKWLPAKAGGNDSPAAGAVQAAAASDDTRIEQLRTLPGVDVDRGLLALRGKTNKYLSLLQQFASTHNDAMEQLYAHLDSGNQSAAKLLVHTIKGAAGTLGLMQISAQATQVDGMLKETDGLSRHGQVIRSKSADLKAALEALLGILGTQPEENTTSAASDRYPSAQLQAVRARLTELLDQHDLVAMAYCDENAEILRAALGPDHDAVMAHVRRFAFDAALTLLRTLH